MESQDHKKNPKQILHTDEWGSSEVYVADWYYDTKADWCPRVSGRCLFSSLYPAIFFAITNIYGNVNWEKFPDPTKKYPYEDRNGSDKRLTPVFKLEQTTSDGRKIGASVEKMTVADHWIVGNGLAVEAKKFFLEATGKDLVQLSGQDQSLSGKI